LHTKEQIEDEAFVSSNRLCDRDFSRRRSFTFLNMLTFLMRLCRPSIQSELDRFFRALSREPDSFRSVSKSAFSQARKKLRPEAFIQLAHCQLEYFERYAPHRKSWLGHRVVAIDGSTLCLPWSPELEAHFDPSGTHRAYGTLMASVSTAYDACNQLVLDAQMAPYQTAEADMAVAHLEKLRAGDIVVMDRGYPSFWLFGLLLGRGLHFCVRVSRSWKDARAMIDGDGGDIDWSPEPRIHSPSERHSEHWGEGGAMRMRLVCIELENGERQVLATSLTDRATYTKERIGELYRLRWKAEENYKFLKQVQEVEHFSGKSVVAVRQDFFAKIFMANMASMVGSQLMHNETQNRKGYALNRVQTMGRIRDAVHDLFHNIRHMGWTAWMERMLARCFEMVRPNRKSKRKKTSTSKKSMSYRGL